MPTTLRDVAREAGVSIRTVSRVVNDKSEIAEETKLPRAGRHRQAGLPAQYPGAGTCLRQDFHGGRSHPADFGPLLPGVLAGRGERSARAEGYSVFLCNTDEDAGIEMQSIEVLAAKQVDGMILCGSYLNTEQLQQVSARYNVAIVTSRTPQGSAVVSIPGKVGLDQTTTHLIDLGHRRIGYLGTSATGAEERYEGYLSAMRRNDLPVGECQTRLFPRVRIETARQAARQLLAQAPAVTAIACYNDLVAIGVLQACRDLGRTVPGDVAVVGFDDIPLASLVTPALTTIRVPRHDLGEKVMQLLLRVMAADGRHAEHQLVPIDLIVRDSSGARAALALEDASMQEGDMQ